MSHSPSELTPEALKAETAALQRLAYSLLGDPHAADDAAQETWLAAVQRGATRIDSNWLSVVTRNFARRRVRGESRRRKRELSVARPEAQASTADAVARVEVLQRVVNAVLALDEPYRTTVVLRYWEEQPPRKIAQQMQVPVGTVRTRLRKAGELLRGKLDRSCGDRAAWATPLAAWAAPRMATGAVAAPGIGLLVMSMKVKVAALCLVGLVAGWFLVDGLVLAEGTAPQIPVEVALSDREEGESELEEAQAGSSAIRALATVPATSGNGQKGVLFKVVDQDGMPVEGATINLEGSIDGKSDGWGTRGTDAEGLYRHGSSYPFPWDDYDSWDASVSVTGGRGPETPFSPKDWQDEPLVLQLPPTGSLTVRVRDEDDRPLDGRYLAQFDKAMVRPLPPELAKTRDQDITPGDLSGAQHGAVWRELDRRGEAEFRHVLVGSRLVVRFVDSELRIIPGPSKAGEHSIVELQIPNSAALTGRLLGAGGKPLAETEFLYVLRCAKASASNFIKTDGDGVFRARLRIKRNSDLFVDHSPWLSFRERPTRGEADDLTSGLGAAYSLNRSLTKSINDLGDIQLTEPPLIVAGTIRSPGVKSPGYLPVQLQQEDDGHWRQVMNLHSEDLEDGRFRFRGHLPDLPMRLNISEGEWLPVEPIEFELGQDDLEIELSRGGDMRANFLLDEGAWQNLRINMSHVDGPAPESSIQFFRYRLHQELLLRQDRGEPTAYTWKGLVPGEYRLTVHLPSGGQPIIALEELIMQADQPMQDPRLDAIDLSDLNSIDLSLYRADGSLIKAPSAGIIVESQTMKWMSCKAEDGVVKLPIQAPVDVWAYAPGHVSKRFESVSTDTRIDLAPAPDIHFQIRPVPELPPRVELRLMLWTKGQILMEHLVGNQGGYANHHLGAESEYMTLSPNGSASMQLRFPRTVTPGLELTLGDKRVRIKQRIPAIDLTLNSQASPIPIQLSRESLQAAIKELRN